MLEESQLNRPSRARSLRPGERELVRGMLSAEGIDPGIEAKLSSALVEDMQDGEMGSIRFLASGDSVRRFGRAIAKAGYVDEDGVPVSIVINVDQEDELYEVDFWKVNFASLKRYPRASDIKIEAVQ